MVIDTVFKYAAIHGRGYLTKILIEEIKTESYLWTIKYETFSWTQRENLPGAYRILDVKAIFCSFLVESSVVF